MKKVLFLTLLILLSFSAWRQEPAQRSNVLFAIADDWGWPE